MIEYKIIPSWEGRYYASNDGIIYSYKTNKPIHRELNSVTNRYQVKLWKNSKCKTTNVHVLVCSAFHGPCPENKECSHLDGNCKNNNSLNLLWESRSQNLRRRYEHGTDDNGYKNSRSSLNKTELEEVRKQIEEGRSYTLICKDFNIKSKATLTRIKKGERYSKC